MNAKKKKRDAAWTVLAPTVVILVTGSWLFIRATEGFTLLDKFAASIAGCSVAAFVLVVLLRISGSRRDNH